MCHRLKNCHLASASANVTNPSSRDLQHSPKGSPGGQIECTLCSGETEEQIFQEKVLELQFLYLLMSKKESKITDGDNCSQQLGSNLLQKRVLDGST